MKAVDIMTPNPFVLYPEQTIQAAAQSFHELNIDGAPVVDHMGGLVGLLTKSNLYRAIAIGMNYSLTVDNIMTAPVVTASVNDDVLDLLDSAYGRLPVIDNDHLVGIVTRTDILMYYQEKLKNITEEMVTVIDSAYNAIISFDNRGLITLINPAAERLFNITRDAVMGEPVQNIWPLGQDNASFIGEEGPSSRKIEYGDKVLVCNQSPIQVGQNVIGTVCVFQDISEVEQISSELRYAQDLNDEIQAVIQASYDSIFVTDEKGKVLSVNDAYTRITGIKAEEILGKTMYELVAEGYYDRSATIEVIRTGKPVTFTQRIKTGKTMLVTGNPIFDKNGNLVRVLTNGRDITELNQLRLEVDQAQQLNLHYQKELQKVQASLDFVVESKKLKEIFDLVFQVSKVDSTILIEGESGTGKELIAQQLHSNSQRRDKPFIKINCGAIPETLLESELFGYEAGAFTGARKDGKIGIFEIANRGTLFLDEIGDLPMSLQVKLLRVLQDGEITRIGGTNPISVDVRIIAATNKSLHTLVKQNLFREDLYYRLNVVPIHVPPLRERKEEIPALVYHFTRMFNEKYGLNKRFDNEIIGAFIRYDWPGNIRELKNLIERALVTSADSIIKEIRFYDNEFDPLSYSRDYYSTDLKSAVEDLEKEMITQCLREYGSTRKAARMLGISQTSVVRKASRYGIPLRKEEEIN